MAARKGSGFALPGIAPNDLGDADERENGAEDRPMKVTDHEAHAKGDIETLENPDDSHQSHGDAEQGVDYSHKNIECGPHGG